MICPTCHQEVVEPLDFSYPREQVSIRGKRYAIKNTRRLSPYKRSGYKYCRAVRLVEVEPKKEG